MIAKLLHRAGVLGPGNRQLFSPRYLVPNNSSGIGWAGAPVNDATTLGLPAAWRACNLIADSCASSPLRAFRNDDIVTPQPQLLRRPNPDETRYDTLAALVISLLLHGNGYAWLGEFDQLGYPRQMRVLHPEWISVVVEGGETVYRLFGDVIDRSQLLHIKGFAYPGSPVGVGVVQIQRESLSHAISLAEHGARFLNEGAVPPLAVTSEQPLDADEKAAFRESWTLQHGRNRHIALLPPGLSVQPIGLSLADSQWLESRRFSLVEIAAMFGLPPHYLNAPAADSQTYANLQDSRLDLIAFTLRPWMARIELALSDLLPRGTEVQFDVRALSVANTLDRYTALNTAVGEPWMTVNEARVSEGYEPLPDAPPALPVADDPLVDIDADDGEDDVAIAA